MPLLLMGMASQIHVFFENKPCKEYPAPFDVRLSATTCSDAEVYTVVQPDISVVCAAEKIDDRGCVGAPDLVVEIVSPSMHHDYIRKLNLYEQHGVREYWIVNPLEKLVMIFQLQPDGRYGRPSISDLNQAFCSGIFPGLEIVLYSNIEYQGLLGN